MRDNQRGYANRENREERFGFGENWSRFLRHVDEPRIADAERSLASMLGVETLAGSRFLDIGCGSGLFSLAARRLGARVHAFDCDPRSVACAEELKQRHAKDDPEWTIEAGSILDRDYLASLGRFDIGYAWGVLHHTGAMWRALDNAADLIAHGGKLFIAIYNDQGWISSYWRQVKRLYNSSSILRPMIIVFHMPYLYGARFLVRALAGRPKVGRGMSLWHDMIDWLGGYPFEVARPDAIVNALHDKRFSPVLVKTCGRRHGCNEFVLFRAPRS